MPNEMVAFYSLAYTPYCSTTVTMIRSEALGFLPKSIDHSTQAKGGAMVSANPWVHYTLRHWACCDRCETD